MGNLYNRIENDFRYHSPTPEMVPKFTSIRVQARELAHTLSSLVPSGRELSTALTRLEECVMHANAGIARDAPHQDCSEPQRDVR